jgi:hypothetical protein
MTHDEMVDVINNGGTVLWLGQRITTIEDLPTQEEIDAVYAESRGKSAYESALEQGFVGTEAEWVASLEGAVGPQGPQGDPGDQGPQGDPGADGTGTGDVVGPASSTNNNIAVYDGITGKLLKDGGATLASKQDALGFTPVPNTRTVNGHALSADVTVTKSDVSLGSVTNDAQLKASDLDTDSTFAANSDTKIPSQKAVKTAVDAKQNSLGFTAVPNTRTVAGHALSADVTVSKSDVGLSNVDNTADASKPVSTAQQALVDDTAYDATSWNGDTTKAPSKNAVRDKIETLGAPAESSVTFTDITTNDASTTKHGYLKKLPNDATKFLDGTGAFAVPPGTGIFRISQCSVSGTTAQRFSNEGNSSQSTEAICQFVCPFTGTMKNLYVVKNTAGVSGNCTWVIRKNGADTALTCVTAAGGGAGTVNSDTTHTVAVTAGDLLAVATTNSTTGASGVHTVTFEVS